MSPSSIEQARVSLLAAPAEATTNTIYRAAVHEAVGEDFVEWDEVRDYTSELDPTIDSMQTLLGGRASGPGSTRTQSAQAPPVRPARTTLGPAFEVAGAAHLPPRRSLHLP